MMRLELISIPAAHDSLFVCVTWDKAKKLRKGFQRFYPQCLHGKKNLKLHQKVQEPHKDICIKFQIHLLIFALHNYSQTERCSFLEHEGSNLSISPYSLGRQQVVPHTSLPAPNWSTHLQGEEFKLWAYSTSSFSAGTANEGTN